jgi:flavin-dependent dehydrogenase
MRATVAIIGGGPGGASAAMFLAARGIPSVIIEKEQFPRYHIGESMTGECGALLRELGLGDEMLSASHPIKRGVTVYGTTGQNAWWVPVMARDAATGSRTPAFTWQVRRAEFDKMMLEEALRRGATLLPGRATMPLRDEDGSVRGVRVATPDGGTVDVESEVLLDCSGQNTFLANHGVTGPKHLGNYDRQIAVFSQVAGTIRDEGDARGNTLIFYKNKYHWSWFIPIDDDVVSVGIVTPAQYFVDKRETKADYVRRELRELNPEMSRRIPDATLIEESRSIKNYSFEVRKFTGKGFICIGDAHRFIDPIFSFGLYVSIKEAKLAAYAIERYLAGYRRDEADPFSEHRLYCDKALDIVEDLLDCFWEHPMAFAYFVHERYKESMIDLFAGRAYDVGQLDSVDSMRKLIKRERNYDPTQDLYAVPIGSRYHPERAGIWENG